jgi:hypothetical protein
MKTCERICKQCGVSFICVGPQIGNKYHCSKICADSYRKQYNTQFTVKNYKKNWTQSNRDKTRSIGKRAYAKASNDPHKRIGFALRSRLRFRLRLTGLSSSKTAIKYLGCSIEELKSYLESLFEPGMTWENYGLKGWHIDHKIPLAAFDLTNSEHLKIVCHYCNLQPLWAKDNLKKGNR